MKGSLFITLGLALLFSCSEKKASDIKEDAIMDSSEVNVNEPEVVETMEEKKAVYEGDPYYSLVETLRVREKPSLDGPLLTDLNYGEKVLWLGKVGGKELTLKLRGVNMTGRWYKIATTHGKVGWTFSGALISDDDIIKVGPSRKFKDLEKALASTKGNTIVHIDEGRYEFDDEISVGGYAVKATAEEIEAGLASASGYVSYDCKNTLIEGIGKVELICTDMDANVMWVGSDDITLRNLIMRHEPKTIDREVGCSGNVVTLDIGSNLTIENCELNGCGRVGLYYNTGPVKVTLRNNHIWNNSLCAIIDGNGTRLYSEVTDHNHITFENNIIEKNGDDYQGEYDGESEHEEYDSVDEEMYDGH